MLEAKNQEIEGLSAPAVEQPCGEILLRFHFLIIDFHDDVAAFDDFAPVFAMGHKGDFGHDFIDDEPLEVLSEIQGVIEVWGEFLDLDAEPGLDEKLDRHLLRGQFEFSVVCKCDDYLFVVFDEADCAAKVNEPRDWFAIDVDDFVTSLEAGPGRRAVWNDVCEYDAVFSCFELG